MYTYYSQPACIAIISIATYTSDTIFIIIIIIVTYIMVTAAAMIDNIILRITL